MLTVGRGLNHFSKRGGVKLDVIIGEGDRPDVISRVWAK